MYGTSAVAKGQIIAFRTIFSFHEAYGTLQELFSYRTVHNVSHVFAREDVPEYIFRIAGREALALTHVAFRVNAYECVAQFSLKQQLKLFSPVRKY